MAGSIRDAATISDTGKTATGRHFGKLERMKLPNGDRAVVDIRKLEEYCLNPQHLRGRNKARVFAAVGLQYSDAEALRMKLLSAAADNDTLPGSPSPFGARYIIDFDLEWKNRLIRVRSTWIIRTGEALPRLTSCYVL